MKGRARRLLKNIILRAFFSALTAAAALAQAGQPGSSLECIPVGPFKLDIGAGLRLRGEYQDNFNIKKYGDGSSDRILLERFRLELGLRLGDSGRLFLQGQDAREWGCDFSDADFPGGSPYHNNFDLRQACLTWNKVGGTPVGFKLGRQSIAFTDNRLMGPGEWGNVGRYTWDAAMLVWRSDTTEANLLYAFRVRNEPAKFDRHHYDYDVLALFSTFPVKRLKLHAFYFLQMENFPSSGNPGPFRSFNRHSPGVSLEGRTGDTIDLVAGIVPQYGKWDGRSVRAVGGYGRLDYLMPLSGKPRLGLQYAYGSGDSDLHDGTIRTFDGVFGAVDKYYGRMNLFAWMNLHDLQLTFSGRPVKFIKVTADYHSFFLADKHDAWYYANGKSQRQDQSGASGASVGQEVDLVAVAKASKFAQLQAGYGIFVPGAFVRNTGPHEPAHWVFLQWNCMF